MSDRVATPRAEPVRNEAVRTGNGNGAVINPLFLPGANPYGAYLQPAFAGMKGDSAEDNVATYAASDRIDFGVVVSRTEAGKRTVMQGGTIPVGISVHDHIIGSRNSYIQYDAVSTMDRGKVWVQVGDIANVADGVYVMYDPATGMCAAGLGTLLPNAIFRSEAIEVMDVTYEIATNIALVELHYGLAVSAGTVVP
jgi:hypothetical protein